MIAQQEGRCFYKNIKKGECFFDKHPRLGKHLVKDKPRVIELVKHTVERGVVLLVKLHDIPFVTATAILCTCEQPNGWHRLRDVDDLY